MQLTNISLIGWLHTLAFVIALIAGGWVLSARKGTGLHRQLGWWYVAAMVFANGSAFAIYRFDFIPGAPPRFGPGLFGYFHWLTVAALAATVLAAFAGGKQRASAPWAHVHVQSMLLGYYLLVGGLINELLVRVTVLHELALASSPRALNVVFTPLARATQTIAIVLWLVVAAYFANKVARVHRKPRSDVSTVGFPLRYSGGLLVICMGAGTLIGAFTAHLGYGSLLGAVAGIVLSRRASSVIAPIWGTPSARHTQIRLLAVGGLILAFMLLGASGFYQHATREAVWQATTGLLGLYFLIQRVSHGPLMTALGLSVLCWLAVGSALHLPLPLLAIGDGVIKLGFGIAMIEPLLHSVWSTGAFAFGSSESIARMNG